MARNINTRPTMANRASARIVTVDPEKRIVEAGVRDGLVKVVIKSAGPFFQWPKQGELWNLKRVGTSWELGFKLEENGMEDQPIEDLDAGDAKISSDNIYTKTSKVALLEDITGSVNGTWKVIKDFGFNYLAADATANEYYINSVSPAVAWVNSAAGHAIPPAQTILAAGDYPSISGKAVKIRLRVWANTNATDPNFGLTFYLKPLSTAGGNDALTFSFGSSVASAVLTNAELAASTIATSVGTAATFPSDGLYAVTVANDATLANNAYIEVGARVEFHYE